MNYHLAAFSKKIEKMKLDKEERIEDLGCKGLKIVQDKSLYCFTSDSVILANFLKLKKDDVAVEIGTGCGVVSVLATAKNNCAKIYAFEQDEAMAKLAEKNIKLNNLTEKIDILHEKVQNYSKFIKKESLDVVFSNPPYMKKFTKNDSSTLNFVREYARHDNLLPIQDLCKCTSEMLKFGGRFYVVYSAERSAELLSELIKNNLQPKTMFFTENGKGRVVLIIVEAVKGGKSGVKVLPNLVTNEQDGKFLEKLQTRNF